MRRGGLRMGALLIATVLLGIARGDSDSRENGPGRATASVDFRLPRDISPISYEVILVPSAKDSSIVGTVKMNARVERETDRIVFHAGNITVGLPSIVRANESVPISNGTYDPWTEKYTVALTRKLPSGSNITVAMSYQGRIRSDTIGLYASSYLDDHGETKYGEFQIENFILD